MKLGDFFFKLSYFFLYFRYISEEPFGLSLQKDSLA